MECFSHRYRAVGSVQQVTCAAQRETLRVAHPVVLRVGCTLLSGLVLITPGANAYGLDIRVGVELRAIAGSALPHERFSSLHSTDLSVRLSPLALIGVEPTSFDWSANSRCEHVGLLD